MIERCVGKYTGLVVDNDDPMALGRIRVQVPELLGEETTGWCLPCSPYAGPGIGLAALPPRDSLVFVEWPAGDITRAPIWSGGMWASGDRPEADPQTVLLLTPGGHRITLRDTSGSAAVEIEAASGAKVTLDDDGIELRFSGQSVVLSNGSVSINDGALEVR